MNVTRLSIDSPEWGAFVAAHPAATAFHHPAWAQLLAECYGHRPFVWTQTDDSGAIVAGIPVMEVRSWLTGDRMVSLPFTDCCPALARDGAALISLTLALAADLRTPGMPRLEVRGPLPAIPGVHASSDWVSHTLALSSDPEAIFRSLKKTQVQQCIRKAERGGVCIRRGDTRGHLDTFYRMHVMTRRRLGVPVQPRGFFDLLWKEVVEPGLGFLLVAYAGSVPVAAAVFLAWNGTLVYKYSASDPAYWKLRPNQLILWRAIQWACERGCHTFDMGRTALTDRGLRDFKGGWGTIEVPLVYSTIGGKPRRPPKRRLQQALTLIVRHSPPFVCRAIGEAFYGHHG